MGQVAMPGLQRMDIHQDVLSELIGVSQGSLSACYNGTWSYPAINDEKMQKASGLSASENVLIK